MSKEDIDEEKVTIRDLLSVVSDNGSDDELQPSTDIELANKIVDTLFDNSNLNMITSLTKKELSGIIKLHLLNDIIYTDKKQHSILSKLLFNYKSLKVSEYRQGRSELVKAILGTREAEQAKGNIFRKYIE